MTIFKPQLILALALLAPAAVMAQEPLQSSAPASPLKDGVARYVDTVLIPEVSAISPGEPFTIAIRQTIQDGWHTYWRNPGDSGESLDIAWTLPSGFTAGDLQWPAPHRIDIGPLTNFGYDGEVVTLVEMMPPQEITGGEVSFTAEASWLVCQDICVPEKTTLSLTLPVIKGDAAPDKTDTALFERARAALPEVVAWPGMVEEQNGRLLLGFTPDQDGVGLLKGAGNIEFYPYEWGLIQNATKQDNRYDGKTLTLNLARDSRELQQVPEIEGVVTFTTIEGTRESVIVEVPVPSLGASTAALPAPERLSWIKALGLALLGGLILNLMPCVFPVLSMKALSLVKMSEREQSHAVMHGVMYTLGILVCFAAIAGILIGLQMAGAQIGWGFHLQNPVVVLLLAYLLFLIGLNLSGFFEVSAGGLANVGYKLTQKQGYAGSFFTGMLATLVATPCIAPFMGAAMGYALTQAPYIALSVFLALGFGLALPYLLLTAIKPLRKALPRPGAWMETFRQFLAFPMYASVAWLIWVYAQQIPGGSGILFAGLGLVFIALGIWLWGHAPQKRGPRLLVRGLSVLSIAAALAVAGFSLLQPAAPSGEQAASAKSLGTPFTQAALESALAGDDPVFVDMTAAWCITCKVNERVAIEVEETQALFRDRKVLYMVGDWTNENPEITSYLNHYGRSGVPLYVFYPGRDPATKARPDPEVLPQLLTPGMIADAVKGTE